MRTLTPIPVLLAGLFAGCQAVDPDPTLTRFSDCDGFSDYMADMARQEILAEYRWSFEGFGAEMSKSDGSFSADEAGGSSPDSYSTTNVQEEGVDEADLVKTDGEYLYVLSGNTLVTALAWPHDEAEALAEVAIDGEADGIYLYDGYVVVVGTVYGTEAGPRSGASPGYDQDTTVVTVVDVADPANPEVVRETYAVGELETSRRVDNRLFVVTYADIRVSDSAETPREARKLVRKADPQDWLARYSDHVRVSSAWESDEGPICDCSDVWGSEREGGTWLVNVLSLDLDDPFARFEGESVVGEAETVYASADSIYVAATESNEGPFPSFDESLDTILHKFDISDAEAHPSYRASGRVTGTLVDSFALSEQDDVLRLATTEWIGDPSSEVHTLEDVDGEFVHLDELRGLAPGEEIYAARFVGDIGYLVTYEVELGDPLFTIDLSDPEAIAQAGELEVSGFSNYLHPMDEDHLLSVGMDEDSGGSWYLAVSLFDVSDLEDPQLADRELLDATSSESQTEHHAFNYFADQDALAIPSWTTLYEPVLEVIEATTAGLEPTGRVYQDEVLEAFSSDVTTCAPIRRSVIMDEYAYAVSAAGFTVATLDAPEDTLAAVPFTGVDPCEAGSYEVW